MAELSPGGVRWLKRLLLVLLLATVAGLTALYVVGRRARLAGSQPEPVLAPTDATEQGEGFDHTVTQEGRPVLRIRGRSDRRDEEGNLLVDDVLVTAYRGEERYEMAAQQASYSLERREARLVGEVSLAGPGGFALESAALTLLENGRFLRSEGPVEFGYGGAHPLRGRAGAFRANPEEELFVLRDGVEMTNQAGAEAAFSLAAQRVFFEGDEHTVQAVDEVVLTWDESTLTAKRLKVELGDRNQVRYAVANTRAQARLVGGPQAGWRTASAEGDRLALVFGDDGGLRRLELDDERRPAHLEVEREDGSRVLLDAQLVQADFADGALQTAQAVGLAELVERAGGAAREAVLRRVRSGRLDARFDATGELVFLAASEGVELRDGTAVVTADRVESNPTRIEATGAPVVLVDERGELRAPRVTFTEASGIAHAEGGVQAEMRSGEGAAFGGTPIASSDGPVQVESAEAFWRREPAGFLFRGAVRAWSGERVLLAQQLRGDMGGESLAAAGGVETVWYMPEKPEEPPRQVRVTAATLTYSDAAGELVYQEDVVVEEGQRRLECTTLDVLLTEGGEARRMVCTGAVELELPADGRRIEAERAVYDLEAETAEFEGTPVVLTEKGGGRLEGRRLVYSLATDAVRVVGAEGGAEPASPPGQGGS